MRTSLRYGFLLLALVIQGWTQQSSAGADAQPAQRNRQSLEEAWWTGPMLANSAATLPRGHFLIEPYLFNVHGSGSNYIGSLTYALYGLTDRVSVGLIPTAGFNVMSSGPSSSGVGVGDLTAQVQYRLTQFRPGRWIPTSSIAVQETFPTGKYDQLGTRPSDGLGSGAKTTTLALYSQTYFWLSNGRILRTRFNVLKSFSTNVDVSDVSVYGTQAGFRGHAEPGRTLFIDSSWEYSLTKRWVLALDATYRHGGNTRVSGYQSGGASLVRMDSGSSDGLGFAPAVEYSWKSTVGVLVGVRVIPASHNTSTSITPAVAINIVH